MVLPLHYPQALGVWPSARETGIEPMLSALVLLAGFEPVSSAAAILGSVPTSYRSTIAA